MYFLEDSVSQLKLQHLVPSMRGRSSLSALLAQITGQNQSGHDWGVVLGCLDSNPNSLVHTIYVF